MPDAAAAFMHAPIPARLLAILALVLVNAFFLAAGRSCASSACAR